MDFSLLKKNLKPFETADESAEHLRNLLTILTSENIEMIVYEAKLLEIKTADSLEKCVDVIFESAVSNDCQRIFADFCTKVLLPSVHVCQETQKMITFKEQIFEKAKKEVENFLEQETLNIYGQSSEGISCHKKLRRPIALFRFIGELLKIDFLEPTFVRQCISLMLDEAFCNESTLETLCALLKIAGKKLEVSDNTEINLSDDFKLLDIRKSSTSINPHTRFMIEEVIQMRSNRWEPVSEIDYVNLYNLFLELVEEKLYVMELWHGK